MTTIGELYKHHRNQDKIASRKFSDRKLPIERCICGDTAYDKSCGRSFKVLDRLIFLDYYRN